MERQQASSLPSHASCCALPGFECNHSPGLVDAKLLVILLRLALQLLQFFFLFFFFFFFVFFFFVFFFFFFFFFLGDPGCVFRPAIVLQLVTLHKMAWKGTPLNRTLCE
jgi:hypothetical protein